MATASHTLSSPPSSPYISRAEALRILDVKPATLYTYVSRGLIRRMPRPGRRESLYVLEDVERARSRGSSRSAVGVRAANAIRYGEPIVPTTVTEITPAGPLYRQRSAVELVAGRLTFEAVAELLWTGVLVPDIAWRQQQPPAAAIAAVRRLAREPQAFNVHDIFAVMTLAAGMAMGPSVERGAEPSGQLLAARQIIIMLAGCFGMLRERRSYRLPKEGETVAEALAASMDVKATDDVLHALNAALILCADHELNPATFVGRIAASSEGDLHSCIAAAISTNSGTRIARGCDRLEATFRSPSGISRTARSLGTPGVAAEITASGFNHPLYPSGDPRGRCLLDVINRLPDKSAHVRKVLRELESARSRYRMLPRLELSLVVLAMALRLPAGAAAGLYTLGRIAGWVAHIAEQRLAGYLIRPRAKFTA